MTQYMCTTFATVSLDLITDGLLGHILVKHHILNLTMALFQVKLRNKLTYNKTDNEIAEHTLYNDS